MANCQSHLRYGNQTNMYQRYNNRCAGECYTPERQREECGRETRMPEQRNYKCCKDEFSGMPIAMAYVPWQEWCEIYDICEGFSRGTIFRELDKPFQGRGGCNR